MTAEALAALKHQQGLKADCSGRLTRETTVNRAAGKRGNTGMQVCTDIGRPRQRILYGWRFDSVSVHSATDGTALNQYTLAARP